MHQVRPMDCLAGRVGRLFACVFLGTLVCVDVTSAQSEAQPSSAPPPNGLLVRVDRIQPDLDPVAFNRWRPSAPEPRKRFWDDRFIPAVEHRMSHLSAIHLQRSVGGSLTDDLFYEIATRDAQRGLERATRMAFETLLLEETSIGRLHDRIKGRASEVRGERTSEGRSRLDFDLGISHSQPRFEMSYSLDKAEVSLTVDYDGRSRLEFRPFNTRSRVWARFDPWDDRYSLGCRLEF